MHPGVLHRRFLTDLSSSLFSFVLPLLPTNEELHVKEEVRGLIEKLIKTIEPSARLLSFGSSCNSFGLRNSDMDLVVLIDDPAVQLEQSHLVAMLGDLLERETNFDVKPLPKARIPILKLTLAPTPALPFGIACDIGIENRLAIENTRLLLTYATIDPARVRTLVLFLKVWAKRRRINSPYRGTLSSYGFTLMVLYYLVHVKQPPVLPNLQRIAPVRPLTEDQVMLQGRNVYFFDDVETLRQEWSSANFETVGELLIDFFRYFSHDFQFNNAVLSLRAGPLTKESKGWVNDIDVGGMHELARDRNRLCIEDPFEITYNVARTVTKDGLYTLRGEFMRATRILTARPDRAVMALAELCQEREESDAHHGPRSSSPGPRSISTSRGGYTSPMQNGPWRSHSQVPFDRVNPNVDTHLGSRRGRQSEGDVSDATAQELWLASQGPNLGGVSGLGVGLDASGARGRDTVQRGLAAPEINGDFGRARRAVSSYDTSTSAGSGSISAPLSPHRLYAQLEMVKGAVPTQPNWSSSVGGPAGGYDPRLQSNAGLPINPSSSSRYNPPRSATLATTPSGLNPSPKSVHGDRNVSPLPVFAPFSPHPPPSILKPLNGEPASYISPSTLLSPQQELKSLPSDNVTAQLGRQSNGPASAGGTVPPPIPAGKAVNDLAETFDKLGVNPPGTGAEDPTGDRMGPRQDQASKAKDGRAGQGKETGKGKVSPGKKATI